uniref:BHLH transcription factor bHLH23.1 n=1 Tax=Gardenia jasminoides TaxID=114476 RepID=A0A6M4C8S5_GARJA|nr:bHLH transcription factor bHLH23.1 [Gardenia jasminoides]
MGDSIVKEALKSLSCNNGWSYGAFWRCDQKNSLLLTLQDVYCDEQLGVVIDDMLLQVHMLGQGVIGQSAFTKNHRWMFSDSHFGKLSPSGSLQNSNAFQEYSAFHCQFSNGIKTIVVISVEPLGVVQFGSTQKLAERLEFVSQTKELFQSIELLQGLALSEIEPLSLHNDAWEASGLCAPLISCQSPRYATPPFQHGDSCADLIEKDCLLKKITLSNPSTSDCKTTGLLDTASSLCDNRLGFPNTVAHVDSNGNVSPQQSHMESCSLSELSASQGPFNCSWTDYDIQEISIFNSMCNSELLIDMPETPQQLCENKMSNQNCGPWFHSTEDQLQRPSSLCTFEELVPEIEFEKSISKHCTNDELFQWFSPMTDENYDIMEAKLKSDPSGTSEVTSLSSNSKGCHVPSNLILDNQPSTSVQSSVTNAINSAEKEKGSGIFGNDMRSDCPRGDMGSKNPGDWEDVIGSMDISRYLNFIASSSDCMPEQYLESKLRTSNTLFSQLGLYQRVDAIGKGSCSDANSDFRDEWSSTAKRRKIESPLLSNNEVSYLPEFVGTVNSFQPIHRLNSTSNFESKGKVIRKTEAGSCNDDNCSIIAEDTVLSPKKLESPAKTIKKKAKPGTKPRPRDRQQIHDRLLELRELIPNGEKMSIDRLLHLTIKHLLFLQCVTRHAKRFVQTDELKSGTVWNKHPNSGNGVTWACEVGDQTMYCPLIVEDLSVPGQMLIEILCEEQGFFLEIVDIIRGFGLTVLRGVMEARETKLWARFNVEAEENRHVTRHEIFSSLVQLLQLTGSTGIRESDQLDNVMDGAALLKSYQQSALRLLSARVDA